MDIITCTYRSLHSVQSRQAFGTQAPILTIQRLIADAGLPKSHQSDLYEHHIELLTEVNRRRSRKKTKRQVQVGGVLTIMDANRATENRKLHEMEKNKTKMEREREEAREREAREKVQQQSLRANDEPIGENVVSDLPD
ncbi:hypothetical protein TSTA_124400 [Talaromyces stipitatus ATCC 10500]|uniref:Uncharacterized protein n=1 Tax=Talaromyces stipitatus (strain ATCC 10500 / CBS 375.48 / QM 6759 / NRRL 1006) TaxID=441959 RepID=B8MB15_TALSN|nr:uncharacterized protein TSTA_124400 [Talaromyces stipitatus ATCC 10500]EED18716.1 hypothetical protein TSTA_124400 [Talaromyces stipitatus ATCC 10500]